jgi:multiple sugar transport system ATP-binding protein
LYPPQRLNYHPRDLFVAGFIGSPAMNLVEAAIMGDEVVFGQFRAPLNALRRPAPGVTRVVLGIRPEAFEDAAFATRELPTLEAEVVVLEELGSDAHVFFHAETPRITPEVLEAEGEDDRLIADEGTLLNARVDPRTAARVGGSLRIAVDPARFHFFDPESGASLLEHGVRGLEDAVPVASAGA